MILRDTLISALNDQRLLSPRLREVRRRLARAIPRSSSQALILTGVRRCGKSTLLAQLLKREKTFAFVNFEDTRLFGLEPRDFPTVLSVLDELYPGAEVLGFDEVQEASEWQRLVRALLDRGRTVLLTGSNASLLGRELGVKLTGRHRSFEVLPFSYREYLDYKRQKPGKASLKAYLDDGGFPAYLREGSGDILRELLRDIIHRDIVNRHGLREARHLMNLALFLFANTGQPFSCQRLAKSLAIPTVGQASRYLEYLQDAYLVFALPKFSASFKKRVVSPSKYYAVDTGLRRANSPQTTPDLGARLENAVYLALRRASRAISYAGEKDLWECDFVTPAAAIQVCAELNEFNKARELAGLTRAVGSIGRRRAVVVTLDQQERLSEQGAAVEVVPAWKWLLGDVSAYV